MENMLNIFEKKDRLKWTNNQTSRISVLINLFSMFLVFHVINFNLKYFWEILLFIFIHEEIKCFG